MNTEDFLQKVDLFSNLNPKYLKKLSKVCTERVFTKGDYIIRQNDNGIGLFIILSGKVKIVKTRENGETLEIATHGTGEFFGELAILDGAKRTADVIAVEDTKCIALTSWHFKPVMETHPEIALEILPVLVKRFRETNEKLIDG